MKRIYDLYKELYKRHGDPARLWPQWCSKKKDNNLRDLIAIGAILVQRTSWHNANLALKNLKAEKLLTLDSIASLQDMVKLTKLIKPAGFYQTKPRRLHGFCKHVIEKHNTLDNFRNVETSSARDELLSLYGIGPETADTILLYALDKPSFIIDEYTRRFSKKYNLPNGNPKELFESSLPKDVKIYQNYHVLIIVDQKGRDWCVMEEI